MQADAGKNQHGCFSEHHICCFCICFVILRFLSLRRPSHTSISWHNQLQWTCIHLLIGMKQMFCVELNLQMQICPTASCLHTVRVKNCKRRKVFRELWDSSQWYKYVFCLSSEPPETVTDCELKARILSVNFASEFLYWHEGCTILTTKGWGAVNSK